MGKVINISEAASLAIHCLALIADTHEPVNAGNMAKRLGASRNHMAKVLQQLVKHNYLTSIRGPSGGFIVKTSPENITLLEIYELMEGSLDVDYCKVHDNDCPFSECVYGDIREKLTREFKEFFQQRKVSDIIKIKSILQ